MLVTELSDSEIVLGKLAARLLADPGTGGVHLAGSRRSARSSAASTPRP